MEDKKEKYKFWAESITKFDWTDRLKIFFGYKVRHKIVLVTTEEIKEADAHAEVSVVKWGRVTGLKRSKIMESVWNRVDQLEAGD